MNPNLKKPVEILIRILASGRTVKYRGVELGMAEDGQMYCIGLQSKPNQSEPPQEIALKVDMDVRDLTTMANEIGFDQLFVESCGLALTKMATRERRTKEQRQTSITSN